MKTIDDIQSIDDTFDVYGFAQAVTLDEAIAWAVAELVHANDTDANEVYYEDLSAQLQAWRAARVKQEKFG